MYNDCGFFEWKRSKKNCQESKRIRNKLTCLRCDGKGEFRNEFGLMEKCTSCQRDDITLEKTSPEPDPDEEGMWGKRWQRKKIRENQGDYKKEKRREQQRVKKYKHKQQLKKKGKKPKKY